MKIRSRRELTKELIEIDKCILHPEALARAMRLVNELYIFHSASIKEIINTLSRQKNGSRNSALIRILEKSLEIEGVN